MIPCSNFYKVTQIFEVKVRVVAELQAQVAVGRQSYEALRKKARQRRAFRSDVAGFLYLAPFMLLYLIFSVYPVALGLWSGFLNRDLLVADRTEFVGFDNYIKIFGFSEPVWDASHSLPWRILGLLTLFVVFFAWRNQKISGGFAAGLSLVIAILFGILLGFRAGDGGRLFDPLFWGALDNTAYFTVLSTPLIVAVGLVLALALNRPGRWTGLLRILFFAPYVLSVSVLTLIWMYLLNPSLGLVGELFELLGFEPVAWLTSTVLAMPAIVVATLWWTVGFNVVLYLAGLQNIDSNLYDAASIDGAGKFARFWYVTLPGLSRTTFVVVVLQVISSFQLFGQVNIMTGGGPDGTTRTLILRIYEAGFRDFQLGYASAISMILFVILVLVSIAQFGFLRGKK